MAELVQSRQQCIHNLESLSTSLPPTHEKLGHQTLRESLGSFPLAADFLAEVKDSTSSLIISEVHRYRHLTNQLAQRQRCRRSLAYAKYHQTSFLRVSQTPKTTSRRGCGYWSPPTENRRISLRDELIVSVRVHDCIPSACTTCLMQGLYQRLVLPEPGGPWSNINLRV